MSEAANPRTEFLNQCEATPTQVNINDVTNIRLALDDFLVAYLKQVHGFQESNCETDLQLALSLVLNLLAAVTVWLSYKFKFQEAKIYIGILSAIYLICTGCFNLYYWLFKQVALISGSFQKSKTFVELYPKKTSKKGNSWGFRCCCKPSSIVKLEYDVDKWIRQDGQVEAEQVAKSIDEMVHDIERKKVQ